MGSLENTHASPHTPPAEPAGGLAHDKELDVKLTSAAITSRRRRAERAVPPIAPADVAKELGTGMTEKVRSLLEDPDFVVRRNTEDDGGQISPEAVASRIELLVPARYREASFANFQPATDSQAAAVRAVRAWCSAAGDGHGPMLALVGEQGCGKSHLLYAAMRALTIAGREPYARPWYKLADELRYGGKNVFQPDKSDEPYEARERLWKQGIVLLDELRATAATDFDHNELAKFACWAYDARIAVLVTTNENPIDKVMGGPAASRFTQIVVDGPDYRHA